MKKTILLLSSFFATALMPMAGQAEDVVPVLHKNVYAFKMSPNGKWIGSMAGDASIYNVETGENVYYEECFLGLGNAVANNGMAVGNSADTGVLMYNGEKYYPEAIGGSKYLFCDINAITPDGQYICGIISNPGRGVSMVPFIAEVYENGETSDPIILPYPEEDFFGAAPQFVTAVYMSDNADVVVGNVQDWRGMYSYPVYFTKDASGEWSCTEPTRPLFNPTGIDIPKNPWLNEPPFPEPENFMSGTRRDAYLEAFELYSTGMGAYPYPDEYMTSAEWDAYVDAVNEYNVWYYGNEQAIKDYVKIYQQVLQTTPSFSGNDMAMHPQGDFFIMNGSLETAEGEIGRTGLYQFYTANGTYETSNLPASGFYPSQVLGNGTIFLTRGIQEIPTSMIKLPGWSEFKTIVDYFDENYPSVAEWLVTNCPGGTGMVLSNEEMTFFTGALVPDQLADYDDENADFYYSTYFITFDSAGVESILDEPTDGIYKVYDLKGVKVLETKDAAVVNDLPKGIYIINGKKVAI